MSAGAMTPRVTAVMLAYGDEPWLQAAVGAVLASVGLEVDVVLVDNGCTSGAVAAVENTPRVRVLRPATNTGYAGGCQLGAAEATGDYLALVNSDALVAPDALARLVAVASESGVGTAMGSIRLAGQPDRINTAGNPWHVSGLSWAGGLGRPATEFATRRAVPVASGCCLVLRRAVFRAVGGFAPEYFAYHEDTDLSVRLWQRGLSVQYVPDAVVVHHYEFARNALKNYLLERNRLVLVLTSYRRRTLLLLAPVLALTEAAMLVSATTGGWLPAKVRGYGWLWSHRSWVRSRRAELQRARTVGDRALATLMTARFDAANVPAPPGIGLYNALVTGWWSLVRGLLPRS
jgi:GT2 family glycosyltransferase